MFTVKMADVVLFLLLALFVVLLFTAQRRKQRAFAELQTKLKPGQEVMTNGGLYAQVLEVDERIVTLLTAPGQTSRWDRRAIARIVPESAEPSQEDGADDALDAEPPVESHDRGSAQGAN
ncbi:MAG: preprotein translocase subunit YajC [Actinomycetota bacterium]